MLRENNVIDLFIELDLFLNDLQGTQNFVLDFFYWKLLSVINNNKN